MPNHADPLALEKRTYDIAADGHAPNFLYLTARHVLAIGNERQSFKHCAGVSRRPILPELVQAVCRVGFDLNAKSRGHFLDRDATVLVFINQIADRLFYLRFLGSRSIIEQAQ